MPTFQFVQVSEEVKAQMQIFRDAYEELYKQVEFLPKSRGVSLALTKLEESSMWLNKAITGND
jgi:isocitrate dehydrogenase